MRGLSTAIAHPFYFLIVIVVIFLVYWFLPKLKPEWSRRTIRFAAFFIGLLALILVSTIFPDVD